MLEVIYRETDFVSSIRIIEGESWHKSWHNSLRLRCPNSTLLGGGLSKFRAPGLFVWQAPAGVGYRDPLSFLRALGGLSAGSRRNPPPRLPAARVHRTASNSVEHSPQRAARSPDKHIQALGYLCGACLLLPGTPLPWAIMYPIAIA